MAKLTQKQKIDNAIAALVDAINGTEEVEQHKKERWFKCIADYTSLKRNIPYKGSFVNSLGRTVESLAEQWPNDFEEIVPDFFCQHSGEAFIKYIGTETKYFKAYYIDLGNLEAGIRNGNCGGDKNFAYFYTLEDALAWQEKKFGKKQEELVWVFDCTTYQVSSVKKSELLDYYTQFTSESDCIAARDKYIWDNAKFSPDQIITIINTVEWESDELSGRTPERIIIDYILNQRR